MNRSLVTYCLALAVLAAGAYCPCPAMAGRSSAPTKSTPETCCAAARKSDAPATPAPDPHRAPCQHCDGLAAGVKAKDKHEKPDLSPATFVAMLAPLSIEAAPQLDVSSQIFSARDAVMKWSPPDLRALVCSFTN